MFEKEFTTMRMSSLLWKKINSERNPRENLGDTLERMLKERDRLRRLIKVNSESIPNA